MTRFEVSLFDNIQVPKPKVLKPETLKTRKDHTLSRTRERKRSPTKPSTAEALYTSRLNLKGAHTSMVHT